MPKDEEKELINGVKVDKLTIYELACNANYCTATKLKIFKFSKKGQLLNKGQEVNERDKAIKCLNKFRKLGILKEETIKCPAIKPKFGKKIPLFCMQPMTDILQQQISLCGQMSRDSKQNFYNHYCELTL